MAIFAALANLMAGIHVARSGRAVVLDSRMKPPLPAIATHGGRLCAINGWSVVENECPLTNGQRSLIIWNRTGGKMPLTVRQGCKFAVRNLLGVTRKKGLFFATQSVRLTILI